MDNNREVIELVNKLQGYRATTGCDINIQLPQIVVVGAQSSGKSSVLDGLVGSSILPRGSGTVTKCPIIVQLVTIADPDKEGVEFQDAPEVGRLKDYDLVRAWITERMEQQDGAIRDEPIIIKVFSPNVVTLTVVDLPGIKRITTSGEPDDLEQLIFNLSRKYIREKNAIILAVSPANYDICNSDGILLAKEADPDGNRTIGVLTKLDLMDEGTNARSLLTGTSKDVNVKLGMIGLVNRSQRDIDNNVSIQEQLVKETQFLARVYPDLAFRNGVPFLRKRLHELLVQHILKCLPEIQHEMGKRLKDCQKILEAIPDVATQKDKFRYVSKIIQGFENCMRREIEGSNRSPDYKHVYGGILIKDIFEQKFARDIELAGKMTNSEINDDMILTAFRNSGAFDSFFVDPEAVFRRLAQEQVNRIEQPALKCAESVHLEIQKIAERYMHEQRHTLNLFPDFKRTMKLVVHKTLQKKLEECKQQIKDYIRIQASVIFSLDQQFLNKISALRRQLEKVLHGESEHEPVDSGPEIYDKEKGLDSMLPSVPDYVNYGVMSNPMRSMKKSVSLGGKLDMFSRLKNPSATALIKQMVSFYFQHVKTQTQDYVPKLVADRLITQFSNDDGDLGQELRLQVMDNFEEMVMLPIDIGEKREINTSLEKHLADVIAEISGILDEHKYEDEVKYLETDKVANSEGQQFKSKLLNKLQMNFNDDTRERPLDTPVDLPRFPMTHNPAQMCPRPPVCTTNLERSTSELERCRQTHNLSHKTSMTHRM